MPETETAIFSATDLRSEKRSKRTSSARQNFGESANRERAKGMITEKITVVERLKVRLDRESENKDGQSEKNSETKRVKGCGRAD